MQIEIAALPDRIQEKIALNVDGCWEWTAAADRKGYGFCWWEGAMRRAHRVCWQFFLGAVPEGLQLDHLCRNPRCVNPKHLEPVTGRENCIRGVSFAAVNAAKTSCSAGHSLSGANLYLHPNGMRVCRLCRAVSNRRYRARLRGRVAD